MKISLAMSEEKRDAEKWLIDTCTTIHERDHDCLLEDCQNPICKALCSLALIIEKIRFDATEKMAESDLDEIMALRKRISELERRLESAVKLAKLAKRYWDFDGRPAEGISGEEIIEMGKLADAVLGNK